MRPDLRNGLLALLLAASLPVFSAGPTWQSLSTEQQALVAPALKGESFDQLPENRRQTLAEGARRWLAMSAEQRLDASHQFNTWQQMSPADRKAALDRRERFRQMPRAEQERLLREHRRFESLSKLEKDRLREAFRSEMQQRGVDALNVPTDSLLPPTLPPIPALPPPTTAPTPMPSASPNVTLPR